MKTRSACALVRSGSRGLSGVADAARPGAGSTWARPRGRWRAAAGQGLGSFSRCTRKCRRRKSSSSGERSKRRHASSIVRASRTGCSASHCTARRRPSWSGSSSPVFFNSGSRACVVARRPALTVPSDDRRSSVAGRYAEPPGGSDAGAIRSLDLTSFQSFFPINGARVGHGASRRYFLHSIAADPRHRAQAIVLTHKLGCGTKRASLRSKGSK